MFFDISKFAFMYNDYEYFEWFKAKSRGQLTKKHFKDAVKWKRLRRGQPKKDDLEKIWKRWKKLDVRAIEKLPFSIKARVLLLHLKKPTKYPIIDNNVFKAMRTLNSEYKKRTNNNIGKWEKDYNAYKAFFEETYENYKKEISSIKVPSLGDVDKEIIKRRILDRALWEFGRTLNNQLDC